MNIQNSQLTSISGDFSTIPLLCFASLKTQIGLLTSCTIREITENKVDLNCSQSTFYIVFLILFYPID